MYIPEDKIEEIRAASDVVEVVGEYVKLKQRGTNFVGLCPFHKEKTPSFNVNPGLGIFKCFGCGAGGNVFQFLMRIESFGFPEAVKILAAKAGIVIPENQEEQKQSSEVESIFHALRFAGRFFYQQLTQASSGEEALTYLTNRGFTPDTIKKFGLGYAPESWDGLLLAAEKEKIDVQFLEKAGLVIPRKDKSGYYDRYRNRVIFPIFSHLSKVIGFGGRILTAEKNQPKYINSPETRVYHKGRVLYGLHQSKQAIRKREQVLLVEGYTDVISLFQAGIEHVVATSGTALTPDQIKLLKRYTTQVLVLYDSDSAGAAAALRGIDLLLAQGMTVYGLELPEGEDPDSYVRNHGAEAFEKYMVEQRKDFIAFTYELAKRSGQLQTPEGEGKLTRAILNSIARMPDTTMHEPFIRRASHVLGIPDIKLFGELSKMLKNAPPTAPALAEEVPPVPEMPTVYTDDAEQSFDIEVPGVVLPQERLLILLMLAHGKSLVEFIMGNMSIDEFSPGVVRKTVDAILNMYNDGKINKDKLIEGAYGNLVQEFVTDVLMQRHELSKNWSRKQNINVPQFNEDPNEAAAGAMVLLKGRRVKEAMEQLKQKIFLARQSGGDIGKLTEKMMALLKLQQQIKEREFLDWNV